MSNFMSLSGVHIYNKPLRPRKKPPLFRIFLVLLLLGVFGYVVYVFLAPIPSASPENMIVKQGAWGADSVVASDGNFVTGLFSLKPRNINYRDAKIKTVRAYLPLVSRTTYKEILSVFVIGESAVYSIRLDHLDRVRGFRVFFKSLKDNVEASSDKWEIYANRMRFNSIYDSASFRLGTNSLYVYRRNSSIEATLFIKKEIFSRLKADEKASISYMENWSKNRGSYNEIKILKGEGSVDVSARGFSFNTNDAVVSVYRAGVFPTRFKQRALCAYVTNSFGENLVFVFVESSPKGEVPAKCFIITNDIASAVSSVSDKIKDKSVYFNNGQMSAVFTAKDATTSSLGLVFPRVSVFQAEGDFSLSIHGITNESVYTGSAVYTREKAFW